MGKKIFILVFFAIVLSFSFLVFFEWFLDSDGEETFEGNLFDEESGESEEDYVPEEEFIHGNELRKISSEDNLPNNDEKTPLNENNKTPSCILVRPGNLPDITCSVDYIYKDEVSIKLKNEIGGNLGVVINLGECRPEIIDELIDKEEKSFVFFCGIQEDFFDEQISISYIIDQTEKIEINGFIQGAVQSD